LFFFSSGRRHTRFSRDWSSDVCSSDLGRTSWSSTGSRTDSARRSGGVSSWLADVRIVTPCPRGGRGPVTRVVLGVGPVLVSTVVPFWVDIHTFRPTGQDVVAVGVENARPSASWFGLWAFRGIEVLAHGPAIDAQTVSHCPDGLCLCIEVV